MLQLFDFATVLSGLTVRMVVRIVIDMDSNTTPVTIRSRGCDLSILSNRTVEAWRDLYRFTALQVWTWRGGEMIVAVDWDANYGRGEYVAVVRTGGRKRGTVRTLWVSSAKGAMDALGISFRIWGTRKPRAPRLPRTRSQQHRAQLAVAAHRLGNTFRTLRARHAVTSSAVAA